MNLKRQMQFDVQKLLKEDNLIINSEHHQYGIYSCAPATGIVYVTYKNPSFLSGHARMRGSPNGSYPANYLAMIDNLFGPELDTIEVCSGRSRVDRVRDCYTVDINPDNKPDFVGDGQDLQQISSGIFSRWRCDPPYSENTASKMYNTELPSPIKLLKAGARVIKSGKLMFLLLGQKNYQWCPDGVIRVGIVFITVVPNNEIRCLNIYYKL